jgi:phenylalanyl-tRNA synthetase alpha chain
MEEQLRQIEAEGLGRIAASSSQAELEQVRIALLGRKGRLTAALRQLGRLPAEQRPALGRLANELRARLESALDSKRAELAEGETKTRLDVTLPGRWPRRGHPHPLSLVTEEVCQIFIGLGFEVVSGPEVEWYALNFEALNYPPDHPAMDEQDSFYITDKILLRTQTSTVQIREMRKRAPAPMRVVAPGRIYRRENVTLTHSFMFHQIEGLMIDEGISFADLKGTMELFVKEYFGPKTRVQFRPDFFPFTEPSADFSIDCELCEGRGCSFCKGSGWVEVAGSGLVHPNVLKAGGYDPEKVSGWAFGFGLDRLAQRRFGIEHIRLLTENDMRFLRQF